ncbi:MAG: replicative DNA helicase [Chloroflexi bacterium]|nr:replicative DNA helicase [Chloroflexota bacterium]
MAVERLDVDLNPDRASRTEERDLSLPPHSLQAEEAVLGSVLKHPASVVQVSDFLKPEDFYLQKNRHVFRAMLSLFADGQPIDYHSTADRLQQLGVYDVSGGLLYLSELNLATPSAAHIEHYGRIVERTSIMRQLIGSAQTIAEIAYRDNLDPDTALEKAEQLILSVAEKRVTRDFRSLEDVLSEYMEQIEALSEGEATRYGIPTGFMDLDKLLGGFQRTDLIILAARTSVGKALALDTPVPTPDGWSTMGELRVGDRVFDERGRPCMVTFATPVQYDRTCYEVVFSDGQRIIADAEHRWSVLSRAARRSVRPGPSVVTTEDMRRQLRTSTGHLNFSIPIAEPLQHAHAELSVDPYVLGVWLGDGTSSTPTLTIGDDEITTHLIGAGCEVRRRNARGTPQFALGRWIGRGQSRPGNAKLTFSDVRHVREQLAAGSTGRSLARQYAVSPATISFIRSGTTWRAEHPTGMHRELSQMGVLGNKHIPTAYLRADINQRLALLQGLMDTDGSITELGYAEFCSTSRALADGVFELVAGLGLVPRFKEDRARLDGADVGPRYRVCFTPTDLPVFRLSRKLARQRRIRTRARVRQRFVVAINAVRSVPVRCIQVDSPNHLYLAGRACVPTHNTSFALNLAVNAAVKHNATVAIFSLEMSAEQLASRLLSMESGVDSPRIRSAHLNEQESRKLDTAMNHLARAPIWVDDTPSIPIMELRSKARRLAAEHHLDMIVVDYLQLVVTEGGESRVQEIGQISRALKALARELRVPVLALSQLSRAVEQRTPHIPQLSDLRESGCLTGDTRVTLASGRLIPIASLLGQTPEVLTMDNGRMRVGLAARVWHTGFRPVFKLTTDSGRAIRATGNHKFRTLHGWTRLDDLRPNDQIGMAPTATQTAEFARHLPHQIHIAGASYTNVLMREDSRSVAATDMCWDQVLAIEPDGSDDVYDMTVPGTHNFVANGLIVHNSLEQDADVVLFIYRDEKYNPDSEKKGIADIIVAKHRNGPTGQVPLLFLERTTKFLDTELYRS